jgi:pilus assembly protein CpaB
MAMNLRRGETVVQMQSETVIQKEPVIEVLVASANLPIGARLNEQSMKWVGWPQSGIVEGFITIDKRPEALKELNNAIVRMPIFDGEPIRSEKIADPAGAIMSSLLPSGKRAVSVDITVSTSAGGFILPNDRVDVIMVKKSDDGAYDTETILSNIRVLAVDQAMQEVQEKEGEEPKTTVTGTTATLELTPDQAKVIAVAQQMADKLTLALRSVADAQEPDSVLAKHLLSGEAGEGAVQVIKSGVIQKLSTNQVPENDSH